MFVESVTLSNFQCFGPGRTTIRLDQTLTAFIGANGSGKTAACQALLRLFGVTAQERAVQVDDFHVPIDEVVRPTTRELTIEVVLAFPELDESTTPTTTTATSRAVPEFFQRMAATDSADLKVRIVLTAEWVDDNTVDGAITETRRVVRTFAEDYTEDDWTPLTPAERSRVQMIYVPASRDGARQVGTFLRGRLWRAAQWSAGIRELASGYAAEVAGKFAEEPVVSAIETALTQRWQELHDAGTCAVPAFRLLDGEFSELVRRSELVFEPDHSYKPRPARLLSDGQRSLLHIALTAAVLDVEAELADGKRDGDFALDAARLPNLTLIAVEEPENSLAPFFLSRIVAQLQDLSTRAASQALLSSHSASALARIRPEAVRYFRVAPDTATAAVREITMPANDTEAGKFLREAVFAHPELYFAKFVVLGEGDTEQLVIPRVAQAQGVPLDPSFVAVVPLGGRHTNHMWRLLNDLDIPHATLLDLDYGRVGAGPARMRDACRRLMDSGINPLEGLSGYNSIEDINDALDLTALGAIAVHLMELGVFFAGPLDLDFSMLSAFPDEYKTLEPRETGPHSSDALHLVIGDGDGPAVEYWKQGVLPDQLRWYRYLFLSRSKPSSHLRALGRLDSDVLREKAPVTITSLITHIRAKVGM